MLRSINIFGKKAQQSCKRFVSLPIALAASSLIITQEHKKRKASSGKASGEDRLVAALQSRALQRKQGFDALFAK